MQKLNTKDIQRIIGKIRKIIDSHSEKLTELDSLMGDGDLGLTMTKAFAAADEEALKSEEQNPGKLLMRVGMVIAKSAPSTMGTLVATGFMKGGKAVEQVEVIGPEELAVFLEIFVESVMLRGKSAPGNKTIIDSIYPAAMAFREAVNKRQTMGEAITAAHLASLNGLIASTQMKAQYGRAAYYQDKSIGVEDGGATVGTYILEGFYKHIVHPDLE